MTANIFIGTQLGAVIVVALVIAVLVVRGLRHVRGRSGAGE